VRFLLDENVHPRVQDFLRAHGHDVTSITRDYPHGMPDTQILLLASREQRILITNDRDFGELVFRLGGTHSGVIYLRIQPPHIDLVLDRLDELLSLPPERFSEFLIVTRTRIRSRGSAPGPS